MTKAEIQYYTNQFHRFQLNRENLYTPKFYKALKEQVRQFKQTRDVNQISLEPIHNVLKDLYYDSAITYGAKVAAYLKVQAKQVEMKHRRFTYGQQKARMPMGFSERMMELIRQYLSMDLLNTSEGITQTTRELVQKILTEGYAEGLSIDEIVDRIENEDLSRVRARVIARTETVGAANQGAVIAARETGLKLNKIWSAANDRRTRNTHIQVDENKVPFEDAFLVGGYQMMNPGDRGGKEGRPKVDPKEYIQCRCCALFEPVRDSNGRLVRA